MTPHSLESALSIVVPVHNDACNLVACLAALQRAGVQPLEVIVVDDASVVDVSSIANEAGARYVRLAKQVGPAGARNAGWRAAQGEIVLFIDSDVVVSPDAIRGLMQRFRLRPDVKECSVPTMIRPVGSHSIHNFATCSITTFIKHRAKKRAPFGLALVRYGEALWRAPAASTNKSKAWRTWSSECA